jgi:hypothetical protein
LLHLHMEVSEDGVSFLLQSELFSILMKYYIFSFRDDAKRTHVLLRQKNYLRHLFAKRYELKNILQQKDSH